MVRKVTVTDLQQSRSQLQFILKIFSSQCSVRTFLVAIYNDQNRRYNRETYYTVHHES